MSSSRLFPMKPFILIYITLLKQQMVINNWRHTWPSPETKRRPVLPWHPAEDCWAEFWCTYWDPSSLTSLMSCQSSPDSPLWPIPWPGHPFVVLNFCIWNVNANVKVFFLSLYFSHSEQNKIEFTNAIWYICVHLCYSVQRWNRRRAVINIGKEKCDKTAKLLLPHSEVSKLRELLLLNTLRDLGQERSSLKTKNHQLSHLNRQLAENLNKEKTLNANLKQL